MSDARAAARHAAAGLDAWQLERFEQAETEYRAAVTLAPADDPALGDYHGELAAVLEALGQDHEAEQHLLAALAVETSRAVEGDEIGANVARYFLAEFLLRHGQAQRALDSLLPYLIEQAPGVWLLHAAEAEARVALGDGEEADVAARRALRAAPSDDQRSELRLRFLEIGLHDAGL